MKRMLMLATTAAMTEQFNKSNIEILIEMGYEVHVAGNFLEGNPISEQRLEKFKQWLEEHSAKWFHIPATRCPYDIRNNGRAYRQVLSLIKEYQYEFIHCHTPIGSVIGRLAAHKTNTRIIYTAHGFHFFKGAPLKNWVLYYPVEKFLSRWTDMLILINKEDYHRAKKNFHAKRTEYIPGVGVDTKKFHSGLINEEDKRKELGVSSDEIMCLSVGELIERKNHETVIHAIALINNPYIQYFICGKGEKEEELRKLVNTLGLQRQVHMLGFRADISELCQAADLYIFPSRQEGLPVALMEAIACKTPVICSDIRGNCDLIKDKSCMFEAGSPESLVECIKNKLEHTVSTKSRDILRKNMLDSVQINYENLKDFDLAEAVEKMSSIYRGGGMIERLMLRQKHKSCSAENKDIFILLSVGELQKRKNHKVVIEALHRINNPDILYLLVGQGEEKETYEKMIKEYGLAGRIYLLGFRTDIPELCRTADCFVHPSIREGLGIAPLEAMASGLPLISADVNGMKDYAQDGITGCTVNPFSVEEMCEAISKMMRDEDFRKRCGNHNTEKAKQYDIRKSNEKMKKIYMELLQ